MNRARRRQGSRPCCDFEVHGLLRSLRARSCVAHRRFRSPGSALPEPRRRKGSVGKVGEGLPTEGVGILLNGGRHASAEGSAAIRQRVAGQRQTGVGVNPEGPFCLCCRMSFCEVFFFPRLFVHRSGFPNWKQSLGVSRSHSTTLGGQDRQFSSQGWPHVELSRQTILP